MVEGYPQCHLLLSESKFNMKIAQVTGSIVSTMKLETYTGLKLLLVQPLDLDFNPRGDEIIAVDNVDAGIGDRVLILQEGGVVKEVLNLPMISPIRSIIVGVIDHVTFDPHADTAA